MILSQTTFPKIKIIRIIIAMILVWFSKDLFWFYNFKNLYAEKREGIIINIRQGRGGTEISTATKKYFNVYCNNEEKLKIGDSISKRPNSDEFKIYTNYNKKWNYSNSIFIRTDLDFYSLIVKK
ncbi:hypothetical protein ACFSJW_09145 [Flavobacterium artemisiae]|uniref:Uncharacterized protein n=1 Tax=Flavobacterium artemisiae TaxID=2126556 RepID=A0ABW4HFN4_9FLAO